MSFCTKTATNRVSDGHGEGTWTVPTRHARPPPARQTGAHPTDPERDGKQPFADCWMLAAPEAGTLVLGTEAVSDCGVCMYQTDSP